MSNGKQKTYDAQTAKFLAVVSENMPPLEAEWMQDWIENPRWLKKMLSRALSNPSLETPEVSEFKEIVLATEGVRCKGTNPFMLGDGAEVELMLRPEFEAFGEKKGLVLRPELVLTSKNMKEFWSFGVPSNDTLRTHQKMNIHFNKSRILSLLAEDDYSLSDFLRESEIDYVNNAIEYIEANHPVRLSVEEVKDGWTIYLYLMKEGATLITATFFLPVKLLFEKIQAAKQNNPASAA